MRGEEGSGVRPVNAHAAEWGSLGHGSRGSKAWPLVMSAGRCQMAPDIGEASYRRAKPLYL